jgi:SHS2 domain-containing protein
MPFEEIPHTADWSLRVSAADLPALLSESARGMLVLSGIRLSTASRVERLLKLTASDPEDMLVSFLSELLFLQENEALAFDDVRVQIDDNNLSALLLGSRILSMNKAIKAVTYHNMHIRRISIGYEVEIVFDV